MSLVHMYMYMIIYVHFYNYLFSQSLYIWQYVTEITFIILLGSWYLILIVAPSGKTKVVGYICLKIDLFTRHTDVLLEFWRLEIITVCSGKLKKEHFWQRFNVFLQIKNFIILHSNLCAIMKVVKIIPEF